MLTIKVRDFTTHKFRQLCEAISSTYPTVTISEYLDNKHPEHFILMRHDVDRMPGHSLTTAKIEHELGIRATYYFRSIKRVFKPDIIRQIRDMGHETGYHYETLSETDGDPEKAITLFLSRLDNFKLIKTKKYNNFYILTHPERWSSSIPGWGLYYSADLAVNIGKKILMKRNSENQRTREIRNNTLSIGD